MRLIDKNGKDWGDIVYGVIYGVYDNYTIGIADAVGVNNQTNVISSSDYNTGRIIGDVVSVVIGATEIIVGGAAIGVPVAAEGAVLATHGVGTISKALQGNGRVSEMNSGNSKKFNGGNSTDNKSAREAFRNAKDQNGVPRSQQPNKTTTKLDKNTGKPLKQYKYTNSKGEKVSIRKDNPITYPDGGKQGPHYNAGKPKIENEKLKQHHNYED